MHKAVEPQIIDVSLSPFLSLKINLKNLDVKKKETRFNKFRDTGPKREKNQRGPPFREWESVERGGT